MALNETESAVAAPAAAGKKKSVVKRYEGIICLVVVFGLFYYLGQQMGMANMLNTLMHTAHDLLLNTVFYLMGICVLTGALGRIFVEFGVVNLVERLLRPLMKPLFRLPGVASLGAVMTFLSDNPAIISLASDKRFSSYFKKYQFISLTNFGTAFGMGLLVMVFMVGQGYFWQPAVGFFGAFCGCIVSTRLMQVFIIRNYPNYLTEDVVAEKQQIAEEEEKEQKSGFIRVLNSLLDGGRTGVDVGLAIIPGVLIICSLVMMLTNGPSADGTYTGAAYEGVRFLPFLAEKGSFILEPLFGFSSPEAIGVPITALGAAGAATSMTAQLISSKLANAGDVAVFTAMCMCWSGYLSTHVSMMNSLKSNELISKAIISHTIGGLCAGISAHWLYVLFSLFVK